MAERKNEYVENIEGTKTKQKAELIIRKLCKKWKIQFEEKKMEWDRDPGWPAKLVETTFKLYGQEYSLGPTDIGLSDYSAPPEPLRPIKRATRSAWRSQSES